MTSGTEGTDMPQKPNLVIADVFDGWFMERNTLKNLRSIWALGDENTRILPQAVVMMGTFITSEWIREWISVNKNMKYKYNALEEFSQRCVWGSTRYESSSISGNFR
eukprot:TRINITY_DN12381_c0_g1_i1.p1 TRINITY_DN12381_c0_g1~~TRINITY_DN12381_c0_g1_i1.p1  ORF type:complete len:107 (+),score=15.92 TRINITY_DN12381_c0_g1_i1:227-547(+)